MKKYLSQTAALLLIAGIFSCILLQFPQVRMFIITNILEVVRSREIKREFWMVMLSRFSVFLGVFFLLLALITFFRKNIQSFFSPLILKCDEKTISNIAAKNMKVTSILFYTFLVFVFAQVFSLMYAAPIKGDDWVYSSSYNSFYNIFSINITHWLRGRHFTDILTSLAMRPVGRILYSCNVDALLAQKIAKSIVGTFYIFIQITALSVVVYILNNKKRFEIIFLITTLISLYLFSFNDMFYFTITAAYVASFGFSLLGWIPCLYYWCEGGGGVSKYTKNELCFFKRNPLFATSVWIFILYGASFTLEQSSLTVTGLSFFMIVYYIISAKTSLTESKEKIPNYLLLLTFFHILLTTLAFFINAFFSGRGLRQQEMLSNQTSTFLQRAFSIFAQKNVLSIALFILGIVFLVVYLIRFLKKRKIFKSDFISFSFIFIGIVGIFAFSVIQTSYTSCLLFIVIGILMRVLQGFEKKSFLATAIIPIVIVFFAFLVLNRLDSPQFLKDDSDKNLLNVFISANENNLDEIILIQNQDWEKQYIQKNPDDWPNRDISAWMYMYGYTKKYIKIRIE